MNQKQLSKIDGFLSIDMYKNPNNRFNVSVRINTPLNENEVVKFKELGFADANTQRRILYASLSDKDIKILVNVDKVVSISLVKNLNTNN